MLVFSAALALASVVAQTPAGARTLVVVDAPGDDVDGAQLAETLEAYVNDVGVEVRLEEIADSPSDHDAWVVLAATLGEAKDTLAVVWLEPAASGDETTDTRLVLLERDSGAVIVLPIALRAHRGTELLRMLAATTRMVLDTEILDGLRKVADVSRLEQASPPPGAAPAPNPRPLAAVPSIEPARLELTKTLRFSYIGDVGFGGPTVLHGARAGFVLGFTRGAHAVLDVGYLAGARERTADISTREQRISARLGAGVSTALRKTALKVSFFWAVEMLWSGVEPTDANRNGEDEIVTADTGGGMEVWWAAPLYRGVGVFVSVSGQGMAVSHSYERLDETAVHPSYFRLGWSVGLTLAVP